MRTYHLLLIGGRYDGGSIPTTKDFASSATFLVVTQPSESTRVPACTIDGARAMILRTQPVFRELGGVYERCSDGAFRPPKLKSGLGL